MKNLMNIISILMLAACAGGQTLPSENKAAEITGDARKILQKLHDRKATLKDFTAKIDYSVLHPIGDTDGMIGTAVYVDDGTIPKLAASFTHDTEEGKITRVRKRNFVLDGDAFTMIDFKGKEFKQQKALPGKPFKPNSLDAMIPVPIGLDVDEVIRNFLVTLQPSTDPNIEILRVVPREKEKYDYKQIDITIDKKLEIPVKIVVIATNDDITTVKFSDPQINTGKVDFPDTTPPKAPGWTIEIK